MLRITAKVGDIISIPLDGNNKYGVAKVIYLSKIYKNVVLLNIYPLTEESIDLAEINDRTSHDLLLYTSVVPIRRGEWRKIANIPLKEREKQLSKRIVGGEVWLEDIYLGKATEDDNKKLPRMLVYGVGILQETINKYLREIDL